MRTLNLVQGSAEWHQHRANAFNASDAPAMMSISPYKTRSDLLHERATGITPEIDDATQLRFNDGHLFEALARPLAESIIGEELSPVTGLNGKFSASFDGIVFDHSVCFEHKTLSDRIRAAKSASELPKDLRIQMEHQLLVSGAEKCLFMASKWNDGELVEEIHYWYMPDLESRERIVAGWEQFEKDLAAYVPTETIPAAVAAPIIDLPAIVITATGSLAVETNFARWGMELKDFIARIPAKPATDQEFADCKAAVAALKKAEAQLDSEESRVLSMVPSIDDMKREKKLLRDLSSVTRLALEKLVVQRETAVKVEIMQFGKDELALHIAHLNVRLDVVQLPPIVADFAAAIKSKRNLENMRGAVSDLVAEKKIESNALADKIQINLKTVDQVDVAYRSLFADFAALVMKAPDDLALVIKSRIETEDKRRIEERDRILEAEREKMRQEETAKAEAKVKAEQGAKSAIEREAVRKAESEEQSRLAAVAREIAAETAEAIAVRDAPKEADSAIPQNTTRKPTDKAVIQAVADAFKIGYGMACDLILDVADNMKKAA